MSQPFRTRYRRILWFFGRVLLSLTWWDILLPRLGLGKLAGRTRSQRLRRIAQQFRTLALQMGGVMIKMGQFLSARLDVLPRQITDELAGLQDEVQPAPFEQILPILEQALGSPLQAHFAFFETTPLAAASIGQVYRAWLPGDDPINSSHPPVVVKVQRPQIAEIVAIDLEAMRVVARWANLYPPVRQRVNVPLLVEEFSRALMEEIDYLHEGQNAETFAHNFAERPEIYVPRVLWSHTTRQVLTLENIPGIKISDYAAIEAAGISRPVVARLLFDTYLKQIFEDRFFHADPHPGNLFLLPRAEGGWQLVFIDFGMASDVPPHLLLGLREILISFGTRDAARLIRAYQTLGVLLPDANLEMLERLSGRAFDRFWGKSTTEMMNLSHQDAVTFVQDFGELLQEMPFQAPENIILLARCLGILSGICSGLDPDFNVWTAITPYVDKLVRAESGGGWRFWLKEATNTLTSLAGLPRRADVLLRRLEDGKLETRSPELRRELQGIQRGLRRLTAALLFGVLLLSATLLHLSAPGLALAAAIAAGVMFLGVVWP